MGLTRRELADNVMAVIRVQKHSTPGTGGEPVGSPYFSERATCARPLQKRLRAWRAHPLRPWVSQPNGR